MKRFLFLFLCVFMILPCFLSGSYFVFAEDTAIIENANDNRPLADAYASEEDPSAVYGNTDSLVLRSEKGKSTVVAMSYFSEALRTNNLLRLPAVTTPQRVDVIIADGVLIDEATFNYSVAETLLKDAVLAGRYMLGNSPVDIDLTSFMAEIEGEYFTVLLVAAPARTVEWSFDDFTTEDLLTGKSPSYNRCWSTEYNISVGGGGKSKADFVVYADKDGNQSGMFHVNGYNRRYKFYNTISDRDITAEDIGRQFTVSFDIMCTTDSVANTGLKCAINGDGVTTGPSAGGYHMNTYHTKTPITLSANVWQTVSFTVEIDQTIVDHQVGCVTIDFVGPDSEYRDYYVDNMSIVEVSPNVDGTENRFDAVEGDGKGLALSSSFSSVISVTLDRSVTVLEAEISLSSPDAEASVTDVFRIFCSTADYTLLSMENHTGKLFFTMNGKTYYLCDGKGSLYTASKTLLKVVAFYDNTAGTVRFAVGDKLAYYTDGTEAAVTYGLSLVTGGHTGEATVAVFSQYDNASVSLAVDKITADKPIIVGTQTSVIGKDLRVLSGIETLYYSEIGFIVEREGKPSLNWKNDYIFTSVKALGETVTAQELGAEYLSAFILTGLDDAETGDSIHITPVAYVGSTAVKGETVSLIFTVENGSVSVATCSHPEQKEIDRKDPKPLADGSVTYQCSVCGCRETESIPATRSLKILAIGNSFSSDALSYFRNLIEACGLEDYITGHMFIGGCSLDDHWANAQSGEAAYSYWKHTPSEHFSSKANLETALTDEEWDVITIQQNSASSGIAADYSNIQNMIDYIQGHSLNSDAKILWHMTWAYQGDCTKNTFVEYFNSDQMTMYNSIVNAVTSKVLTQEEIADIIPSGTSIQNLRSSYLGDTLTRDGSHLSFDVGRYTAGLTLLVKLTGASIDELTWVPENYPLVERDLPAIKEAVKNAIATPFAVTQSTYLEADYETEEPEPDDSTETEIVAGSRLKLALTPTEGDTGLFLSFGQDVGEYVMLDWVPTYQSFWDSTLSMSITIGEDDTARKYIGSRLIEKNELPVGTVIVVDEGYQYCPEAWVDSTTRHTSDTRPIACAETVIIIDETWWGEYNYRAFNLSRAGGEVSPEDADHLRIYIPIDG